MTFLALFAHSFGRLYTLPVPFWMYIYGASAALALSFVVVAYFVGAGTAAQSFPCREFVRTQRGWLRSFARALSVALLLLCIATGLFGSMNPYANFNMTFFWIVFVLGLTYASALAGDLYAPVNPWAALAGGIERTWKSFGAGRMRYPRELAYWPALALYMAFIWLELFGSLGPRALAVALLAYTAITLAGVFLVGRERWFRYGEFFGVFFRLIAKMAPLAWRDGRLRLRPPFVGLLDDRPEHLSLVAFVLFMLSSTAFDGLRETAPWVNLFWVELFNAIKPQVGDSVALLRAVYLGWQTLALLASPFLYLAIYLSFVWLMKLAAGSTLPTRELALRFAYTLLPIALVYNVTHYYTLIATQGVKIVPLLSDPFGRGWNLFGTAGWLQTPIIPAAGTVWHTQVALIVFGHIVSVYLAHVEALRTFPTARKATLSQVPMLVLMVLFTSIGLWILAQPINSGV